MINKILSLEDGDNRSELDLFNEMMRFHFDESSQEDDAIIQQPNQPSTVGEYIKTNRIRIIYIVTKV